jgi:hypothetical protein
LYSSAAILLCASAIWYLTQTFYLSRKTHGVGCSAVWHNDEAFVFLNRNTSASAMKGYQIVLGMLGGVSPGLYQTRSRKDLLVFRVTENAVERYCLPNFGAGGGGFPANGKLYFDRGGDASDWPYVWRWDGTTFTRLDKATALSITELAPPDGSCLHSRSKQIEQERWSEHPFFIFNKGTPMRYPLDNFVLPLTLITSRSAARGRREAVVLEDTPGHLWATLSVIDDCEYHLISERDYAQLPSTPNCK